MDYFNLIWVPLILMVWSLAVKYHPALAKWPNAIIPWLNTALALLLKLVTPEPAHAGVFGALGSGLGWLWAPVQAVIAAQIYECWVRPVIEHYGIGKALPKGGHAAIPVPKKAT